MWFPLNVGKNPHLLLSRLLKIISHLYIAKEPYYFCLKWRNELNLLISSVWQYTNYCVDVVYWNIFVWNQQIQLIPYYFLFLIQFWCSFQSFGTPWLYKFSFNFRKSVSVCSSSFRSFSVDCDTDVQMNWPFQKSACTPQNAHCHGANFEAKQGRPLFRFSVQRSVHTTYL